MNLGWEFPPRPYAPEPTPEEWERFDALGARVAKLRPYHVTPATLDGLRTRGATVMLRPNADGELAPAPVIEAGRRCQMAGLFVGWVVPDNEPNLHNAPPTPDYLAHLQAAVNAYSRELAGAIVLSPPLAVAQGEARWYAALAPVIATCGGVAVHLYGQNDTGLAEQSIWLAELAAADAGIELLIADEVGDSSPGLGPHERAAAVAEYVALAERHDFALTVLFILGGSNDSNWDRFVLETGALGPIRDAATPPPANNPGGTMELKAVGEPLRATVGETAEFTIFVTEHDQVVPIEGIATAFIRAPRDAEGYTLGFGDQISFDAENLDLDPADVDGKLTFRFEIPEFAITGPTQTSLDLSVLAMSREPVGATHVNGSFPLQLLPADDDGEGDDEDSDDGVPAAPGRAPPSLWTRLAAIFATAAAIANSAPATLPDVQAIHRAIDAIKVIVGFSEGEPAGTIAEHLAAIRDAARHILEIAPEQRDRVAAIREDVAGIRELAGNFR